MHSVLPYMSVYPVPTEYKTKATYHLLFFKQQESIKEERFNIFMYSSSSHEYFVDTDRY